MPCNCIDRATLISYFQPCSTPTAQNFTDLINALFHACEDDTICNNLLVEGSDGFNQVGETASLFLGDRHHSIQSTHSKGVTINTFGVNDAFFIEQGTGKVGIGTTTPSKKLDVNGDANIQGTLCADDLDVSGNVNVQGTITATSLNIAGSGLVPVGAIIMWSGNPNNLANDAPGWALCDGTNGTPDLRGRFVVGKSNNDLSNYGYPNSEKNHTNYNTVGDNGGLREVKLTAAESGTPGHTHSITGTGTTNSAGSHKHGVPSTKSNSAGVGYAKRKDHSDSSTIDTTSAGSHQHSVSINGSASNNTPQNASQPHENLPPYYVLAFIMKL